MAAVGTDSDDAGHDGQHRHTNGRAAKRTGGTPAPEAVVRKPAPGKPAPRKPAPKPTRATPRPVAPPADELPGLRRRSPLAYWVAVLVLMGMVATLLGGVIASIAR